MSVRRRNYWLDTAEFPKGTRGDLPGRADVAIVGAGFTGLSAALALARRGVKVAVFEAHTIGWGASSRNGGMVLTGTKLPVETLTKRYGIDAARRIYAASLASIDFVEQVVNEAQIDCDFSRCGHLEVASKQAHFDAYARNCEVIEREFGHRLEIVPRRELGNEIGSGIYYGGIVDKLSAGVNPARYVAGLARAALAAGAAIYENTRVVTIDRNLVRTPRGDVQAGEVIVGTSGYTSAATPALRRRIIPIGSFIIATERLPEDIATAVSPRGRMIFDSKHYLHYFRLTPDRRMLFGGRAAFFPETETTTDRSAGILGRDMLRTYPQLRGVNVEYCWGGTLDFCFDTMPHAGRIDGMHYAVGYAGHGVAMASYLGAQLARLICGEDCENPFADIPCPKAPAGLYNGRPWFLPLAGAWYKLLDWFT